jgi:hypothetical protein
MPFLTEAQRRPISSSFVRMSNQSRSPSRTPGRRISPPHTSGHTPTKERPGTSIENDAQPGSSRPPAVHLHSALERQITRWIASRGFADELDATDADGGAATADLPARLRDGVLLGRLLEGLDPGLRLTGFNRKARSRAAAIANLELVLAAVWRRAPLARDMPSAEEVNLTPAQPRSACGRALAAGPRGAEESEHG